jgi:hypothetical protein
MPADYTIDSARRVLVVRFWGRLSRSDAIAIRSRLRADPAFDPSLNDLVDLTDVTAIDLTAEDLQHFGGTPLARGIRYAVVATTPLTYGIARVFQAYRESQGAPIEVFHDRASAERWVGLAGGGDEPPASPSANA